MPILAVMLGGGILAGRRLPFQLVRVRTLGACTCFLSVAEVKDADHRLGMRQRCARFDHGSLGELGGIRLLLLGRFARRRVRIRVRGRMSVSGMLEGRLQTGRLPLGVQLLLVGDGGCEDCR